MKKEKDTKEKQTKLGILDVSSSPHIRDKDDISRIMWSVVLALAPASLAGAYFFGIRALWIILLSIFSSVSAEFTIQKAAKRRSSIGDGSAVLTGLLLGLVLPPLTPWWMVVLGSVFAIAIGKMVFGGLGNNIFNPALAGRAFLTISWPALMAGWLLPDAATGATPLTLLKMEGIKAGYSSLFLGNIGGCIGETSAIALLIGAAFLFYKGIIGWRIPSAYIGSVFLLSLFFGQDPFFHILAGGLLIGAFFMATDYVTSPITPNGKIIFGIGCGFFTIVLRLFSSYAEGVMFAILLMNAAVPLIERHTKKKPLGYRRKR
ncbi:RnfABCDGE type electron transport complex subunit D [Candidatus Woesearchaeota archaeon]|nr:RnfABCDGE type electron transport complex subunit D [Candidatus Woesearchaeota archaeon]